MVCTEHWTHSISWFHVCWLHKRGKTHIKHTLRYSIHTRIHLFIWIFLHCSKDFKNSQSWSICHFACMCLSLCVSWIFIVCEHLAIHFHLNCPLAFGLFPRSFVRSFVWFCCCFNVCMCAFSVYFSLIFFKWSRRWQWLFNVLMFPLYAPFSPLIFGALHKSRMLIWIRECEISHCEHCALSIWTSIIRCNNRCNVFI